MHHAFTSTTALALGTLTALAALAALAAAPAAAQSSAAAPQAIDPQVQRRDVKLPSYPSRDIAVGLFAGTYATQNFGASTVAGVRLSYHITEDFFVDATLGQTKVSDENFRQVLPGGIFVNASEKLSYYAVSAGWNLLPGEVFFGRSRAKASQGYIVGGIGSTRFAGQRRQTVHYGLGWRLIWNDRVALQVDVRDHMFSLDLLGKRESTHNPEITAGLTLFF